MNEELKLINKDADTAVLFIHGILGTPRHFDFLLPLLPPSWSKWALLLPGHGGSVVDFAKSSMDEWKSAAENALLELWESHRQIYVVGHSMGTLLAVYLGNKHPEKISGIFAMAMPLKIRFGLRALRSCLHTAFRAPETDTPFQRVCREACSVELSKNPFSYLGWIPRYLELFTISSEARKTMPEIKLTCTVIQSAIDELVSPASVKYTAGARTLVLPTSTHFYYSEEDREIIKKEFEKFIQI